MAIEQGVVEQVSDTQAHIRMQRSPACASCGSRHMCYSDSNEDLLVEIDNTLKAKVGDRVEISMPTGSLLRLSVLVYCGPILAMIAGAYVGQTWAEAVGAEPTPASIFGGIAALTSAFIGLKRYDRAAKAKGRFLPRMTRILPGQPAIKCSVTPPADNR